MAAAIAQVLRYFVLATITINVVATQDIRQRKIMRAEKNQREKRVLGPEALSLNPKGAFAEMDNDPDVPEEACNNAYPLGMVGLSQCLKPHHDLIIDPDQCNEAATMTGASVEKQHFVIKDEISWDKHPRGCFAAQCEWKTGMCYFYNPIGGDPCTPAPPPTPAPPAPTPAPVDNSTVPAATAVADTVIAAVPTPAPGGVLGGITNAIFGLKTGSVCTGTAVCYAAQYLNGTTDTNGGCRVGYQVIMTEKRCKEAASCLGFCTGGEDGNGDFLVGTLNASQHMDYPEGCFIHPDDGCFYLNEHSELGTPTGPLGVPVCRASQEGHMWAHDTHRDHR